MNGSYLVRGILAWMLIALAETLHGAVRSQFLRPITGDLASRQIGVITGSALILAIAWLVIRWIGATTRSELLAVGTVWLILMVGYEVALGRAFGVSWERILADYDLRQGGLMLIGMCILFLAPSIAAGLRGGGARR